MKITKVDIPESKYGKRGIKQIVMDKLGDVVLIAGKNGSGKTRLLNIINQALQLYTNSGLGTRRKKTLTFENKIDAPAVWFVPKNLNINDSDKLSNSNLLDFSKKVDQVGVNDLAHGVLSKIQVVQNRWFNATHPTSSGLSQEDKDMAIRDKEKNYKNGKLHGFWTQQFANAQLNTAEFSSK